MMKIVVEKLTFFWRLLLLVVEPHSMSTKPSATISRRFDELTGTNLISIVAIFKSALIASTTFSISSCE
jgi:hypothetical protein